MPDIQDNPIEGPLTDNQAQEHLTNLLTSTNTTQPEENEEEVVEGEETPEELPEEETSEENESSTDAENDSDLVWEIGGEEVSWTQLKEWRDSGLRQADYTQKSQANAEIKRDAEKAKSEYTQGLEQIMGTRQQLIETLETLGTQTDQTLAEFDSINWTELKADDPIEYSTKLAEKNDAQLQIQRNKGAKDLLFQQQQTDTREHRNAALASERLNLQENYPEWFANDTSAKEQKRVVEYLQTMGLSDADMQSAASSSVLLQMARDASLYHQSKQSPEGIKAEKKVIRTVKRIKGRAPTTRTEKTTQENQKLMDQLIQTGGDDAAIALLMGKL